MRQAPAGAGHGFGFVEGQELGVALRPPREAVDAVEPQHVVDAEDVEDIRQLADAPAPPAEAGPFHVGPAVERDAPVLPPLLHERIVLEDGLRRCAARPVEVELFRLEEHIHAVVAHPDGDIAHQAHPACFGVGTQGLPLREGDPLDERVEGEGGLGALGCGLAPPGEEGPGFCGGVEGIGPGVPCLAPALAVHQEAERAVVVKPTGLGGSKGREARVCRGIAARHEPLERGAQQAVLRVPHCRVIDQGALQRLGRHRPAGRLHVPVPQARHGCGRQLQQQRVQRHRTDGVVRAVVGPGLVDRQQLEEPDSAGGRPVAHLAQGSGVADAEVVFAPQGEGRYQHTGGPPVRVVGRRGHGRHSRRNRSGPQAADAAP